MATITLIDKKTKNKTVTDFSDIVDIRSGENWNTSLKDNKGLMHRTSFSCTQHNSSGSEPKCRGFIQNTNPTTAAFQNYTNDNHCQLQLEQWSRVCTYKSTNKYSDNGECGNTYTFYGGDVNCVGASKTSDIPISISISDT